MIGKIRLYEKYHANIQRISPDKQAIDLRLGNPWPELEEFCMKFPLESMEYYEHKFVPYVVFLVHALKKYGKIPSGNKKDELEFVDLIKKFMRFSDEENIEEAILYKHFAYKDTLSIFVNYNYFKSVN